MTVGLEDSDNEECSDPVRIGSASGRPDDDRQGVSSRRVMTDGGQAQAEPEEGSDEEESETAADEQEGEPETADGEPAAESEAEAAEAEEEREAEAEEAKAEDEAGEAEAAEAEETEGTKTEEEAEEAEEDEAEEAEEDEAEEEPGISGLTEDDREEGHAEDAEDVYEGDDASGVLHLDLDGLFLDVLGLEVNLNPVTLDVSARPGGNNLLGNLLSAVTGLLDGPGALLDKAKSLLEKPIAVLRSLPEKLQSLLGKPGEWLGSLAEKLREGLASLVSKPVAFVKSLFGIGGEAEEEAEPAEDEPAAAEAAEAEDTAAEDDAAEPGRIASAIQWIRSTLSGAAGRVKERLVGLVPGFPIEELVATIVRSAMEQLLDQLEPEGDEATEQQDATQAEASS